MTMLFWTVVKLKRSIRKSLRKMKKPLKPSQRKKDQCQPQRERMASDAQQGEDHLAQAEIDLAAACQRFAENRMISAMFTSTSRMAA